MGTVSWIIWSVLLLCTISIAVLVCIYELRCGKFFCKYFGWHTQSYSGVFGRDFFYCRCKYCGEHLKIRRGEHEVEVVRNKKIYNMTEKENNLLKIAKVIAKDNPKFILTGSLMLAVRGINKRREACDLDFICPLNYRLDGCKVNNAEILFDDKSYAGCFKFKMDDLIIDVLPSGDRYYDVIDGIKVASIANTVMEKQWIIEHSKNGETRVKHHLDLLYLRDHNEDELLSC